MTPQNANHLISEQKKKTALKSFNWTKLSNIYNNRKKKKTAKNKKKQF